MKAKKKKEEARADTSNENGLKNRKQIDNSTLDAFLAALTSSIQQPSNNRRYIFIILFTSLNIICTFNSLFCAKIRIK